MEKKTILIVDDETDLLKLLNERLTNKGYSVITADNGDDGIRLAREKKPDLIILDILMPGISGTEVAQTLKGEPGTKTMPIIFLTCLYTREDAAVRGHNIKGNFFIAKPFDADMLLAEIENHLQADA